MSTIEQLNRMELLSDSDTISLKDLAAGSSNILIVGNDKQMNKLILKAIVEQRVSYAGGWYFKEWSDSDFHDVMSKFTVLNASGIKSYEDAREIVRFMTNTPIVIEEIKTTSMAIFYLECCVGLRNRVTATYTLEGNIQSFLNSFSQLTKPNIKNDHPNPDLVMKLNVEKVHRNIDVLITYNEDHGKYKVSIIDRRNE